jgi:uncharacterized membrane protein
LELGLEIVKENEIMMPHPSGVLQYDDALPNTLEETIRHAKCIYD